MSPWLGSYGETAMVTRSPGNNADVVAAHAAADLREEFHAIVALDPVVSTGERLHNDALDLNEIVACQGGSC